MKKNILVLALLGLSISSLIARQRDVLTNGAKDNAVDTKKQQKEDRLTKEKVAEAKRKKEKEAARLKKEQDDAAKAADKAARQEEAKAKRAADRDAKVAEKEAKKAANPKLTKNDHKVLAQVHTNKAKKLAAQVQDVAEGLENLKAQRRAHTSAHLDRVADTPDEVKQSHLLNVRYAPNKEARKVVARASCEAHGTCKTAQVEDLTDGIVAQRAKLKALNAQHVEAKDKARRHHGRAGTLDRHEDSLKTDLAKAQAAGVKAVVGGHRFSNEQKTMAEKREAVRKGGSRKRTTASAAELQAKVRKVETLIAQARQQNARYLASLEKKPAQRLAQAKQPKKWSAPKLHPVA